MDENMTLPEADKEFAKTLAGSYLVELGLHTKEALVICHVKMLVAVMEHAIRYGRQVQQNDAVDEAEG